MTLRWYSASLLILTGVVLPVRALGPEDVFLLVNRNVPESRQVAEHYCQRRGVPEQHIITLDLPTAEDVTRADFVRKLRDPLRAALKDRQELAKVLISTYGVPLRVGPQESSVEEKAQLDDLNPQIAKLDAEAKQLHERIKGLETKARENPKGEAATSLAKTRTEHEAVLARLRPLQDRRRHLSHAESQACVDSELALLWWDGYDLRRWQPNLLNFQVPESERQGKPPILVVSRLDGPTVAIAKGLVDKALEAETKGLAGRVYVDARGIKYEPAKDPGSGYGGYDESLREMARLLDQDAKFQVTLDDRRALFASASCPECALYCGWYSLAKYVDCCRFVPGAVAYHIASSEAVSLRNPKATYWCKGLLENGVAATLGPVAEPYTIGFPKPAEFFGLLVTGKYTLVECYARTALLNSWMTVLVGDPLYNPFARDPRLKPEQVKPSPREGQPFWRPNVSDPTRRR